MKTLPIILLVLALLSAQPTRAGEVSLQTKLVWAHAMITFPLDLDVVKPWVPDGWEQIYPRYPLDTRRSWPGGRWHVPDVQSAKAAGVDGFAVDIFSNGAAADGYLDAADELGNFQIAPCLDLSGTPEQIEAQAIKAVDDYCDHAAKHPSAAKVNGAFLIFTYNSAVLPPQAWQRVRDALAKSGRKTYWMADLDMGATALQSQFPGDKIAAYFPVFESGYFFGGIGQYWTEATQLFKSQGKPFVYGGMPGYARVGGGYRDARATQVYRGLWQGNAPAASPWMMIVTWNDLSENTEIMPNSDWNTTRSELTRWEAAKWKNTPLPWPEPRLYLTTPQALYPGATGDIEALVLNGSPQSGRVTLDILDGDGKRIDHNTWVASPHRDFCIVNSFSVNTIPAKRFFRARATLSVDGKTLASVLSAPILVPDPEANPGLRTLYYSVPAHKSLPGTVKIAIDGTPTSGKTAQARVIAPPGIVPQFSEILFNGEVLKNFLTLPPTPLTVPVRVGTATVTPDGANVRPVGAIKGGTEWGFYMARVTDKNYRVGYSDPIYFPPPGDLTVKEHYDFDEGQGKIASDMSVYQRAGELQNVAWVSPGVGGKGSCVRFNGQNARINLSLSGTPTGPVSFAMAVRPRAYGGDFFCDSGGLWMTTTPEGKAVFTRLGPDHTWRTATGKTTLPLNQWTALEFTWDGQTSRIFVNGVLDGQAEAPPQFTSDRRALGCNPFGSGSGYYNGDLDAVTIKALPPSPARIPGTGLH